MLRNKSKDEFTSEMAMWNSDKLIEYIEEFFTNIRNKEMIISLTVPVLGGLGVSDFNCVFCVLSGFLFSF
jgi:hypothetical protein